MSLSYLYDPNKQFQDLSGKNNVNGFLKVFVNGTDDFAPTYKNFDGTFNNKIIRLDNNGRAVVIVDDTMTYRLEVYDRDGAMLWTQYPVKPSNTVINYGINNTYVMNADVRGTPDEIDVSPTTDPQTGFKTFFVKLSSTVKNFFDVVTNTLTNHGDTIGNLQTTVSNQGTAIGILQNGKKDKQDAVTFKGSATKTVKKITQDENGEVTVEYEDIDLPQEVPNVDIVSPNNTISVTATTDPQTNTKTFTIDVKEKPLSLAWVESGNMTYSPNTSKLYTNVYSLLYLNNWQNPQGDKITYDPNTSKLWLAKGYYTILARIEITWEGTPQNKTISIGDNPFDLSYNHKASAEISALHQLSATTALAITVDVSEMPPQGFTVKVKRADIYSVQQVMENVVQGLESVTTDDTLAGDGTSESPLSVVVDDELDEDSENPVQNKVLYGIIGNVETLLEDL